MSTAAPAVPISGTHQPAANHPAAAAHIAAASHHAVAEHHHLEAAHHLNMGEHEPAEQHETAAMAHSEKAHAKTVEAAKPPARGARAITSGRRRLAGRA